MTSTANGGPNNCLTRSSVSKLNSYSARARPSRTLPIILGSRSSLIQDYEGGIHPPNPASVAGSVIKAGTIGTLTVPANNLEAPSAGGWPLVIVSERGSIPIPAGTATLDDPCSTVAQQTDTSRGKGLCYNIAGSNHSASAKMLAVTGCSRGGKGALMACAFETRIALSTLQESDSGGYACPCFSRYEESQGSSVQTAIEIVGENVWFSSNSNNYVNNLNQLPYDHNLFIALAAPRDIISYGNTN
ncbi:hypothetical protein FRC04_001490 [Tulasnella sp. 424]|nr:hypothetical protein FRC04_001490 [Tulasnella sp. 424]KAG8974547.1 hypothetical protein FRC05_007179 [Tulasnella sp. 425]